MYCDLSAILAMCMYFFVKPQQSSEAKPFQHVLHRYIESNSGNFLWCPTKEREEWRNWYIQRYRSFSICVIWWLAVRSNSSVTCLQLKQFYLFFCVSKLKFQPLDLTTSFHRDWLAPIRGYVFHLQVPGHTNEISCETSLQETGYPKPCKIPIIMW